jgi:hypothetical protein
MTSPSVGGVGSGATGSSATGAGAGGLASGAGVAGGGAGSGAGVGAGGGVGAGWAAWATRVGAGRIRNVLCAFAVLPAISSSAHPVHARIPDQWRSFIVGTS